jgi:hypothetical protein
MFARRSPIRKAGSAALAALVLLVAVPATAVLAVSNDERENATVVAALPFVDTQDTSDATTAADDPYCYGNGATVWYRFDATSTVDVVADTFGSEYDTTLSVYVDDGVELEWIECNDDTMSLQSRVGWTAEAGTSYLIMVGAYGDGPGGALVFSMDVGTFVEPQVSVDIVGASLNRSTGDVTVELSVSCSEPGFAYVDFSVRQRAGRTYVNGYGWADGTCDTEPSILTATTMFRDGIFAGGNVEVRAFAEAAMPSGWAFDLDEESLRLQVVR